MNSRYTAECFDFNPRIGLSNDFVNKHADAYLKRMAGRKEFEIEKELNNKLPNQNYITKDQLIKIAKWKSPRIIRSIERNESEYVIETSRYSFISNKERFRIEVLRILTGVDWPVASTILHFKFPTQYTIIDFRALWTLGIDNPPPTYTFSLWKSYNDYIVEKAKALECHIRKLDMALWEYSKIKQK